MRRRILVLICVLAIGCTGCADIFGEYAEFGARTKAYQRVMDDPATSAQAREAIAEGKIYVGMTKDELIASWGVPTWWSKCNSESVLDGVKVEILDYSPDASCSLLVYVRDGMVVGWSR